MDDRTQAPTPKRRREARLRGQVARSRDVTWVVLLLAVTGCLHLFGGGLTGELAGVLRSSLSRTPTPALTVDDIVYQVRHIAWQLAPHLIPWLGLAMLAAAFSNLAQFGWVVATAAISPAPDRISPGAGLRRLLSRDQFVRNLFACLKLITLLTVAAACVWNQLPIASSFQAGALGLANDWGAALVSLSFRLACALAAVAIIDLVYERWRYERGLRMTRQEVRDEQRQQEGDPLVRRQVREATRDQLRRQS